jgi:hypothetical protein
MSHISMGKCASMLSSHTCIYVRARTYIYIQKFSHAHRPSSPRAVHILFYGKICMHKRLCIIHTYIHVVHRQTYIDGECSCMAMFACIFTSHAHTHTHTNIHTHIHTHTHTFKPRRGPQECELCAVFSIIK